MANTAMGSRGFARAGAMLVIGLLALTLRAAPALAHATFTHGTPGPNQTVCNPTLVDDYFAQHIVVSSTEQTYDLWVTNSSGNQVDNNDNAVDPNDHTHMTVSLPPNLPSGTYTVNWSTLSDDDGDQASGSYNFTVAC